MAFNRQTAGAKAQQISSFAARLKSCPDTRLHLREFFLHLLLIWLFAAALTAQTAKPEKPVATTPAIPPPVHFTDITAKTGITFQHASAAENKYIVMAGGVLLLDYDRDGWLDIYFTNAPTVDMALRGEKARSALYHNNHDGTFTDVTDKAGVGYPCWAMGGAVGDYNNDGWPDIYVTCLGRNVLYRNNGDGTFTDVTEQAGVGDAHWSTGAAFADYDGDGFVDLFVSNYVDRRLEDVPRLASAPLCPFLNLQVECGPRGLKGAGDTLYHNNGDGTFTEVSKQAGVDDPNGYYGMGVVWSDFNDDGRPDLYVANDATPHFLYRNDGKGRFTEMGFLSGTAVSADGSTQAGMGVAVCDYLHSGRFSIYVTNFAEEYSTLYRNDGNMSFTDVTYAAKLAQPTIPYLKWGTACMDFDNDGWPDIFVVNGHVYPQADKLLSGPKFKQRKQFFWNQHDGTFRDASNEAGDALKVPQVSRGAAFGDLFNDGNIDVVVENIDGAPMIVRNDGNTYNHWIAFELAGATSNRLAIGARVKAVAGGLSQIDEVRSGGSYLSQNDMRVHFGLGTADHVDRVEVRWPSGKVETISNLAADHFYALKEGSGVVPAENLRPEAMKAAPQPAKRVQ
jgi:hypothetical protein